MEEKDRPSNRDDKGRFKKGFSGNDKAKLKKGDPRSYAISKKGYESSAVRRNWRRDMADVLVTALNKSVKNADGENVTLGDMTVAMMANGMASGDPRLLELGLKVLGCFAPQKMEVDTKALALVLDEAGMKAAEEMKGR